SATGLEISSDTVRIASAAAGSGLTGGGGSPLAVGAGTGITVGASAVSVDASVVSLEAQKFAATSGDNSNTSSQVEHSLGTQDIIVQVYEIASGETVLCDVTRDDNDNITLDFAVAPTTSQYCVVIHS